MHQKRNYGQTCPVVLIILQQRRPSPRQQRLQGQGQREETGRHDLQGLILILMTENVIGHKNVILTSRIIGLRSPTGLKDHGSRIAITQAPPLQLSYHRHLTDRDIVGLQHREMIFLTNVIPAMMLLVSFEEKSLYLKAQLVLAFLF